MRPYAVIRAAWDVEAGVWYVESSDIPGLVTEAETLDALRAKLPVIVQDLLQDEPGHPHEIEIDLIAYSHERIRTAA